MPDHDLMELCLGVAMSQQDMHNQAAREGWSFYTYPMDGEYWFKDYGYTTLNQVEDHMDVATWYDWYKDTHGCRPWYSVTAEEARQEMREWRDAEIVRKWRKQKDAERQAKARRAARIAGTRNNQMAEQLKAALGL